MKKNNTTPKSKRQDKAIVKILKIEIDIHKSKYGNPRIHRDLIQAVKRQKANSLEVL